MSCDRGAFAVGFFILQLVVTEFNSDPTVTERLLRFRKSAQSPARVDKGGSGDDLEKNTTADATVTNTPIGDHRKPNAGDISKAFEGQVTDNVFSFQHLNYEISLAHSQKRRLLDDVSGYVQPGKLTALMGER
jgi:ATP-binding cassette, subfamily G (WHITE), member 2, SNQ2